MLFKNHSYTLNNNKTAHLIDIYKDYFTDTDYAVFKVDNRTEIATLRTFEANLKNNLTPKSNLSSSEKVSLYRSYFRGRGDVFAKRWENKETGEAGWQPWCWSRNKPGCPRVKNKKFPCSRCHVQNFVPMTDDRVMDHLRGKTKAQGNKPSYDAFYGIYPIMPDNQVYFLAIDFDKGEWQTEVKLVVKAAEKVGLEPLLELSQSGNGCHIWFFFSEAIPAYKARQLGNGLLNQVLQENPLMAFSAFDRLFPNQDDVNGGFGNLIALPLQGERAKNGTSRFIDKEFRLVKDIWHTLETTKKIGAEKVDKVIQTMPIETPKPLFKAVLQKAEQEVESLFIISEEQEDTVIEAPITIRYSNVISIKRDQLTNDQLLLLRYMTTFPNKKYQEARYLRLPTYNIPKLITLAEIDQENIDLPRGMVGKLEALFPNAQWIDERVTGNPLEVTFKGNLYPQREKALSVLETDDEGLLKADTGFGKTVVGAKLIADKKVSTLVLVHNKTLASQWKTTFEHFLEIKGEPFPEYTPTGRLRKKEQIGKVFGGKDARSGLIDIALFQSLHQREDLEELLSQYGMVIIDEAHHVTAVTFEEVIAKVKSQYLYGLTATPEKDNGLEPILFMRVGEVVYEAQKEIPLHIQQDLYLRFTSLGEQLSDISNGTLHEYQEMMIASEQRNQQILEDIKTCIAEKRHIIFLTRYVKHLEVMEKLVEKEKLDVPVYVLNSKRKSSELRAELAQLKEEGRPFLLLTTGSYAGEGFDLPALDTLMLAMPNSGASVIKQYLGRLQRNLDEKDDLRVYDYVDYAIPTLFRMYQKRMRIYRKLDYQVVQDQKTDLYQSNLFGSEYRQLYERDLSAAKKQIDIYLQFPAKAQVDDLLKVPSRARQLILLHVPPENRISKEFREVYRENLMRVKNAGIRVMLTPRLSGNYGIIDSGLVWILPQASSEESVAMRIYSEKIAERIRGRFV